MRSSHRLQFTREARSDVRDILQYTRETWGLAQRNAYAAALDRAFARPTEYPRLGPERPDLFPGCHTKPVEEHIIYYRITQNTIRIIRVLHARQDASAALAGERDVP
jgi:toxin ParE1/3/4